MSRRRPVPDYYEWEMPRFGGIHVEATMRLDMGMVAEQMSPHQIAAIMDGMANVLAASQHPRASGPTP